MTANYSPSTPRPRARDLGIPFDGEPGTWNAITDVPGLEVGYTTLIEDGEEVIRTGVTAILPRGKSAPGSACAAGVAVLNGNGELTGRSWIDEAGQFQMPVAITNSHAVGPVHQGIDRWMARNDPSTAAQWMLPVVGETWDGYLNSINAEALTPQHAMEAFDAAGTGPLQEGNVGGGTGMNCYGFKGGTGTASRVVRAADAQWTVGVLLQANFGQRAELRVAGHNLGKDSQAPNPMETTDWLSEDVNGPAHAVPGGGSVIVVVATDAPMLPDQCRALARRVPLGLARTGTTGSHFSGDIFLAFSTANQGRLNSRMEQGIVREQLEHLTWSSMDDFYTAVVEATEEAVLNALVAAEDMVGRKEHTSYALPHEEIRAAFATS
ncbi:P1 family peptidase [Glutamicibacter endophyticus]|uniref:DmpA family aminopeptidase n=1 Tax=Glutamicibacter endophyticus TaxID=1522174 RepID=UPI003AF0C903